MSSEIDRSTSSAEPLYLGHPPGLFTLFFAEMWERFSYYGMRALLLLYLTKSMLMGEGDAKSIYGAYTALVYMTPFLGGLLADRFLGTRVSVILGGILMALGHVVMMREEPLALYVALALLITGNGFFKPNISSIVGTLYPPNSPRRDGGFTIFYMGINLGATASPLLCGYIGEKYGWHLGFGLAAIGMLVGLAVFVLPTLISRLLILAAAASGGLLLLLYHPNETIATVVNAVTATFLVLAAVAAFGALSRGGLPVGTGLPPGGRLDRKTLAWTLILTGLAIPIFTLLVSGFSPLHPEGKQVSIISEDFLSRLEGGDQAAAPAESSDDSGAAVPETSSGSAAGRILAVVLREISKPAGLVLGVTGILALGYLLLECMRTTRIARQRMFVVLILTFFQLIFWAFFEQAGSSLNLFADQVVRRVNPTQTIGPSDVGQLLSIEPTQAQIGYFNGDQLFTMKQLNALRAAKPPVQQIEWQVSEQNIGMGLASREDEIPASLFQSVNPAAILMLGLVFSGLWTFLARRGVEPSTPVKFALGLIQLGLGFGAIYMGVLQADERGMVWAGWLVLGYVLHTTGELCLSPVGLSMVTKLTPSRLVSTMMGMWFLATAFSQYAAGMISQFTGVDDSALADADAQLPSSVIGTYGDVYYHIGLTAIAAGLVCWALTPLLKRWMHADYLGDPEASV